MLTEKKNENNEVYDFIRIKILSILFSKTIYNVLVPNQKVTLH